MKIIQTIVLASAVALAAAPARAQSPLNVVTTTEDLAAIAREVGGDKITVESIALSVPGLDAARHLVILRKP